MTKQDKGKKHRHKYLPMNYDKPTCKCGKRKGIKGAWRCPKCKKVIVRPINKATRSFMTPKGWYRSTCQKFGVNVVCRPLEGV
jgi:tRNA(Ile2) C34 agmatinyltransferase TiaS